MFIYFLYNNTFLYNNRYYQTDEENTAVDPTPSRSINPGVTVIQSLLAAKAGDVVELRR